MSSYGWSTHTMPCNTLRFGGKVGVEAFIAMNLKNGDGYYYDKRYKCHGFSVGTVRYSRYVCGLCRRIPKSGMQATKNAASPGAWVHYHALANTYGPEF